MYIHVHAVNGNSSMYMYMYMGMLALKINISMHPCIPMYRGRHVGSPHTTDHSVPVLVAAVSAVAVVGVVMSSWQHPPGSARPQAAAQDQSSASCALVPEGPGYAGETWSGSGRW